MAVLKVKWEFLLSAIPWYTCQDTHAHTQAYCEWLHSKVSLPTPKVFIWVNVCEREKVSVIDKPSIWWGGDSRLCVRARARVCVWMNAWANDRSVLLCFVQVFVCSFTKKTSINKSTLTLKLPVDAYEGAMRAKWGGWWSGWWSGWLREEEEAILFLSRGDAHSVSGICISIGPRASSLRCTSVCRQTCARCYKGRQKRAHMGWRTFLARANRRRHRRAFPIHPPIPLFPRIIGVNPTATSSKQKSWQQICELWPLYDNVCQKVTDNCDKWRRGQKSQNTMKMFLEDLFFNLVGSAGLIVFLCR